jgi:hypothetical protein
VDLAVAVDHVGELVRVGGLVASVAGDGFTLDDGTAVMSVVLDGPAAAFHDLLEVGDAVGLVGRVEAAGTGYRLAVTDPAGIVRLGDLGEVIPIGAVVSPAAATGGGPSTAAALQGITAPSGLPGILGLLVISALSISLTVARRRQARRRLVAVVASRLAGLRAPATGDQRVP